MTKKVIILNGPPGCGKDTLREWLSEYCYEVVPCEMKTKLIEIALAVSGIQPQIWDARYNNRDLKERPWYMLGGLTQREFLIKISEEWVKPVFGKTYFGRCAGEFIQEQRGEFNYVFSDGGFVEEVEAIRATLNSAEITVVQLHGRGDWGNDSRTYIEPANCEIIEYHLTDGQAELDAQRIAELVGIETV